MRARFLILLLAGVVLLSACTADQIGEFVEVFGGSTDLSASEETAPAAASVPAKAADDEAQAASERALETKDPSDLDPAIEKRPHDPRYLIQRGLLRTLVGDPDAFDDLSRSRGVSDANHSGLRTDEQDRRWTENVLEVTQAMIGSYPPGVDERERLTGYYCTTLTFYANQFGSTVGGGVFMLFANTDLCPDQF